MGRGSTTSSSAYRSFFPTIVTSGLAKLKYNKVRALIEADRGAGS